MKNDEVSVDSEGRGKYGISIGTELAIISYLGLDPSMDGYVENFPNKGGKLWVCVRTMFRNVYNSLGQGKDKYTVDQFVDRLYNEMLAIERLVHQTNSTLEVVFYYNTRNSISKLLPHGLIKEANTEKQKFQETIETIALKRLMTIFYNNPSFITLDCTLTFVKDINVVLTSYVSDLLLAIRVKLMEKVYLVESHTGAIKDRNHWYTKLNDSDKINRIPVTKLSYSVFGDSKILKPYPTKVRKEVIVIAEKNNWNQLTSPRIVDKTITELITKLKD